MLCSRYGVVCLEHSAPGAGVVRLEHSAPGAGVVCLKHSAPGAVTLGPYTVLPVPVLCV